MSKRVRIYTDEDLAVHSTAASCWVTRNGKVYDVTSFLPDHPGGDDLILNMPGGRSPMSVVLPEAFGPDHLSQARDAHSAKH